MVENVLLVTVDSLRYDTWVSLRSELSTHSALADAGVSFERAFATGPGTSQSFPGLLTGTYALSHGGLGPLSDSRPRVAAHLRSQGLATGGFHSNPFLSTHFDYDAGFDEFVDYQNPLMGVATRVFPRGIEISDPKLQTVDEVLDLTGFIKGVYRRVRGKSRPYVDAEVVTDDAIEWLSDRDRPFFCWAHYMDVHHPCFPPEEYRAEFGVAHVDNDTVSRRYTALIEDATAAAGDDLQEMKDLYRASACYVDDQVGRLVGSLRDRGILEDTLVVLTSDHGELHGEYGQFGKPARMYDELLRVPLIVANGPGWLSDHQSELTSLVDVPPLVHHAIGESVPGSYEGRLHGSDHREYVIAEHQVDGETVIGVRSDRWLYERDDVEGEHRLFEAPSMTAVDPAGISDPEAAMVRAVADRRADDVRTEPTGTEPEELDPDVEDRLENLGYR